MDPKLQYETCGWRLLREIESLTPAHPVAELILTSSLYRAIVSDDFTGPEWEGFQAPIPGEVGTDYLFRFDMIETWVVSRILVGLGHPIGFIDSRLLSLAADVRAASKRLESELRHKLISEARAEFKAGVYLETAYEDSLAKVGRIRADVDEENDALQFLDIELVTSQRRLEEAGLTVTEARDMVLEIVAAKFLDQIQEKIQNQIQEQKGKGDSEVAILQGLSKAKSRQLLDQLDPYGGLRNKDTVRALIQGLIDTRAPS